MSDSIFFLKKGLFSVLSYSSLYFPSITPQLSHSFLLFPTTPKPGCSSFRLALPRAIFLLIGLSETPTDKKKRGGKAKNFFPCLYSVLKSAKFSSTENKLFFLTNIKE